MAETKVIARFAENISIIQTIRGEDVEEIPEILPENLTRHGHERIIERVNPKGDKTPEKQAQLAMRFGLKRKDINGQLYRWVEKKCYKYPGKLIRLHSCYLYIFTMDTPAKLVTVFPVPKHLRTQTRRLEKKKRRSGF